MKSLKIISAGTVIEARFRLAGAIRRLAKLGIYALDLTGAHLSNFSFANNCITSIRGSIFYDGTFGNPHNLTAVRLNKVSFDELDCRDVQFSKVDQSPFIGFAEFVDCTFLNTDLRNAMFKGVILKWSNPPVYLHWEEVERDGNGYPLYAETLYGAFDKSDLTNISFAGATFENADFRGAKGILEADFTNATGLEEPNLTMELKI